MASVVHHLADASTIKESGLRCPASGEQLGARVEAPYLGRLRLGSGKVWQAGPQVAVELRVADDQRPRHGTVRNPGAGRSTREDGPARGDAQEIVFDKVA